MVVAPLQRGGDLVSKRRENKTKTNKHPSLERRKRPASPACTLRVCAPVDFSRCEAETVAALSFIEKRAHVMVKACILYAVRG